MGCHPARPRHTGPPARRRHIKVNPHRSVVGKVKTVSAKREGRRWYVVLTAEQHQPEPLPTTGSVVGIDLGIASFLTDSNGAFVPNPRHGRRAAARLLAAQQALSRFPRVRRDKRTANHRRAVEKVTELHRKVRRQRLDHAHKTALGLVRAHDFIAHEDLRIRSMVKAPPRNPTPKHRADSCPTGPPRRPVSTARSTMPDGGCSSRSSPARLKAPVGK
ncbi:RNA-guided endonuclease InsQ/TnpB family protein [Streptomyces sp. NBC_01244]|uniref:RNA-guided endonuclease InsQ/TnpB family protein n=1 Tax=Streptomyces sp. NBC_01244 TaxID=2903797 RepID=UPI002E128D75|nr:transposase [Streptomyces sp. NBC_01244]